MSKPTFTASVVSIQRVGGWCDVEGYRLDALPLLAVTPSVERAGAWVVTHIPTGYALSVDIDGQDAAKWAAWYLADEGEKRGVQWAGSVRQIEAQAGIAKPLVEVMELAVQSDTWQSLAPWLTETATA